MKNYKHIKKSFNDTFGHPAGDKVLKDAAGSLNNCLAECGVVGRIGGDEFAAVIDKEISRDEIKNGLTNSRAVYPIFCLRTKR